MNESKSLPFPHAQVDDPTPQLIAALSASPRPFTAATTNRYGETLVVVGMEDEARLYHGDAGWESFLLCDGEALGLVAHASERLWIAATWEMYLAWRRS